jgi:hypothetical protein
MWPVCREIWGIAGGPACRKSARNLREFTRVLARGGARVAKPPTAVQDPKAGGRLATRRERQRRPTLPLAYAIQQFAKRDSGLPELVQAGLAMPARAGARMLGKQLRAGSRASRRASAHIRPTQQRAAGRTGAPRQLLCREAGVLPCAPPRRPQRARHQRLVWLPLAQAQQAPSAVLLATSRSIAALFAQTRSPSEPASRWPRSTPTSLPRTPLSSRSSRPCSSRSRPRGARWAAAWRHLRARPAGHAAHARPRLRRARARPQRPLRRRDRGRAATKTTETTDATASVN